MTERTEEKRQHRLLVVEDEPGIRTLLESTLSLTGYQVRSTDTGVSAPAEAARQQPGLILLDIMLPDAGRHSQTPSSGPPDDPDETAQARWRSCRMDEVWTTGPLRLVAARVFADQGGYVRPTKGRL
ncbi:response regulator [Streptomyces sp. enrichment culture]|uniref:response regulator n=1 Tax=Streptomyces sp. enrichment culture TaxID=1795815 RepID=UPI003F56FE20